MFCSCVVSCKSSIFVVAGDASLLDVKGHVILLLPQVMHSREAAPGKGAHIMECLRRERSKIKVDACAAHMRTIMRKAYQDNRFDTLFQSTCEEDIRRQCRDRRSALHCLKEAKAKVRTLFSSILCTCV